MLRAGSNASLAVVLPRPSWPWASSPHEKTRPPLVTTSVCKQQPHATSTVRAPPNTARTQQSRPQPVLRVAEPQLAVAAVPADQHRAVRQHRRLAKTDPSSATASVHSSPSAAVHVLSRRTAAQAQRAVSPATLVLLPRRDWGPKCVCGRFITYRSARASKDHHWGPGLWDTPVYSIGAERGTDE